MQAVSATAPAVRGAATAHPARLRIQVPRYAYGLGSRYAHGPCHEPFAEPGERRYLPTRSAYDRACTTRPVLNAIRSTDVAYGAMPRAVLTSCMVLRLLWYQNECTRLGSGPIERPECYTDGVYGGTANFGTDKAYGGWSGKLGTDGAYGGTETGRSVGA
eukprot:788811-Rhodomonas_salina.1